MKKLMISALILSFFSVCSFAEAQDWKASYDGVEYCYYKDELHVVRIDTDLIGVSIFPTVSQAKEPNTTKAWCEKHELEIGVNANFYDMNTQQKPYGMVVYQGKNWGEANGTQYAQIAFTKDNRVKIYPEANKDQPAWMYYAVAGKPEIIRDGKVREGINDTTACQKLGHCKQNRSRTGACLDKGGKHLILTTTKGDNSNGGITVVKFAELMVELCCDYGVNLDGGGSASIYLKGTKYGTNTSRKVAASLGFNVIETPAYICKVAEIDNPGTVFYDMAAEHWAMAAVEALKSHNIADSCGGEDGRPLFCPNCGTKRSQAAVFVFKALGIDAASPATPSFQDVAADNSAYGAIEALVAKNVIAAADNYRPEDVITRADAAMIVAKAYIENVDQYANAPTPTFSDVTSDKPYYASVEALARNCIISGNDGKFNPDASMTRAEFAAMLAAAAGFITGNCVFTKQCETLGATSCNGEKLSSCVAYETVDSDCDEGKRCISGSCAECSADEQASCSELTRKYCDAGSWKTEDCSVNGQICQNGICVSLDECDASFKAVCTDNGQVQKCSSGHFVYEDCDENENCRNGKCQKKSIDIDDDQSGEMLSGVSVHYNDSCSQGTGRGHLLPWLFALCASLIVQRRRRSSL